MTGPGRQAGCGGDHERGNADCRRTIPGRARFGAGAGPGVGAALLGLLAASLLLVVSCAHRGPAATPARTTLAPQPDSVTTALWHMDEPSGPRVPDAGPFRLDGVAGLVAAHDFGRIGSARRFERSLDSFVYVPFNPMFQQGSGLTVEAWLYPRSFGQYEDTPIAARWTEEANRQSWLFALGGDRLLPPLATLPSPGYHLGIVPRKSTGQLVFVFQPEEAGAPLTFFSVQAILLGRWTHVAVTYDGSVVRFYIDGNLDSQYATRGRIRQSTAPILIGNYFDTRLLTTFGGNLRPEQGADPNPYYAYNGSIDELRISSAARTGFPTIFGR